MEEDLGPVKGPEPSGLPGLLRPRWAAAALVVAAAGLGALFLQQQGGFSITASIARVYQFAMNVSRAFLGQAELHAACWSTARHSCPITEIDVHT